MPTQINGIGTAYFGKKNPHRLTATCEHCKAVAILESYDTRLFFTVLYIPLIPLGAKRILDQCSRCLRHRVLPLRVWNEAREREKATLLSALQADPQNKETLLRAIDVAIGFRDEKLFGLLQDSLIDDGNPDPEILAKQALGLRFFGHRPKAIEALTQSLALREDRSVRHSLAAMWVNEGQPAKALDCLEPHFAEPTPETVELGKHLVSAFQAQGDHASALSVIDRLAASQAMVTTDKDWKRLRRISETNLGTNKKIRLPSESSSGWFKLAVAAAAIALIWAIVHVAMATYLGANRTVYVVGALPQPYQVSLNGNAVTLSPYQLVKVNLAEGEIRMEPGRGADSLKPDTYTLESSWWIRPYVSQIMVINPDELAIIAETTAQYSANPNELPPTPPIYHTLTKAAVYSRIDHPFEEFPVTIRVKGKGIQTRKGLQLIQFPTDPHRVDLVKQALGDKRLADYAQRWALLEPENTIALTLTANLLPPPEAEAFLKPGLQVRPVKIPWHRLYQDLHLNRSEEAKILAEYKSMVDNDPNNPDLLYLLSRLLPPRESIPLLKKAIATGKPAEYAHYSLGFHLLCQGKFPEAAAEMEKSGQGFWTNPLASRMVFDTYLAVGAKDTLLKIAEMGNNLQGNDLSSVVQKYRIQAALGNPAQEEEARKVVERLLMQDPSPQALQKNQAYLNMIHALAKGDMALYLASAKTLGVRSSARLAILEDAAEILVNGGWEPDNPEETLVDCGLLLLALRDKKSPQVDKLKTLFLNAFNKRSEMRQVGLMLARQAPWDTDSFKEITMPPYEKRVVAHLAALWIPEKAQELSAFGKHLDFHKDDISLCLKKLGK